MSLVSVFPRAASPFAPKDPFAVLRTDALIIDDVSGPACLKTERPITPEFLPDGTSNAADPDRTRIEIGAEHKKFAAVTEASALSAYGEDYSISRITTRKQPTGHPVKFLLCYRTPQDDAGMTEGAGEQAVFPVPPT